MKTSLVILLCLSACLIFARNFVHTHAQEITMLHCNSVSSTAFNQHSNIQFENQDTVVKAAKPLPPKLRIDPNPVETLSEISLEGIELNDLHYLLVNETGDKVKVKEINSNPFTFDRLGLPGGVFIISILDNRNHILVKDTIILQ